MATIERFEDLHIWQMARDLAKKVYQLTFQEPISKDYRLRDQMRGSCGGIMDNIAEGFERDSNKEFVNSLSSSKGEAGELRSQLYRASDVGYILPETFHELVTDLERLSRSIHRFITYLNRSDHRGNKFKGRDKK